MEQLIQFNSMLFLRDIARMNQDKDEATMMKKLALAVTTACLLASTAYAQNSTVKKLSDVAPYPMATKQDNRHVIWLEQKSNESDFKVEIIASKVALKDCNNSWFGADFDDETVKGWGFSYYQIKDVKGPMSTRMACGAEKAKKADVPLRLGEDAMLRYNSKLPIVVYAPKDVKVQYRIWSAESVVKDSRIENK